MIIIRRRRKRRRRKRRRRKRRRRKRRRRKRRRIVADNALDIRLSEVIVSLFERCLPTLWLSPVAYVMSDSITLQLSYKEIRSKVVIANELLLTNRPVHQ